MDSRHDIKPNRENDWNKYFIEKFQLVEKLRTLDYHKFSVRELKDILEDLEERKGEDFELR